MAEQVAATAEQAAVTADRLETSERERGSVFQWPCRDGQIRADFRGRLHGSSPRSRGTGSRAERTSSMRSGSSPRSRGMLTVNCIHPALGRCNCVMPGGTHESIG